MPNHVYNELSIHPAPGRESDFTTESNRLIGLVKSDETILDFNNVIPMPEELRDIQVGGNKINGKSVRLWRTGNDGDIAVDDEEQERLRREYGADNWYDWCIIHWGTKWNAYSISEEGWVRGEEQVSIEFDTAWTVPEPVVEELSRRFPALRLRLEYRYEGERLGRSMEFDGGEMESFPFPFIETGVS